MTSFASPVARLGVAIAGTGEALKALETTRQVARNCDADAKAGDPLTGGVSVKNGS